MKERSCAVAVMAKAPQAGRSKTRLVPPLSPDEAATMSGAFLLDITENIRHAGCSAPIAAYVAYAPAGQEKALAPHLAPGTGLLLADGNVEMPPDVQGLGRCLLHTVQALFAMGHSSAVLLNADSPTLPTSLLVQAAELLARDRVVLGPAEDGGYYLIGMTAPEARLFADIAWSTDVVAAQTRRRAAAVGLEMVELAPWYDVDDATSLQRLVLELATPGPGYSAPATRALVARLELAHRLRVTVSA